MGFEGHRSQWLFTLCVLWGGRKGNPILWLLSWPFQVFPSHPMPSLQPLACCSGPMTAEATHLLELLSPSCQALVLHLLLLPCLHPEKTPWAGLGSMPTAFCVFCRQRQPGLWEEGRMERRTWDSAQLAPWSPGKAATSNKRRKACDPLPSSDSH